MCRPKPPANFEILVIDDDKITSLLHKNLLKSSNFEQPPVLFRNAKIALEYLLLRNCNANGFLILLDLHMPLYDGWDFLNALKEHSLFCNIHVILVTSSVQKRDELDSLRFEHVIGFCRKPLKIEHIQKLKKLNEISDYYRKGKYAPKAMKCSTISAENTP